MTLQRQARARAGLEFDEIRPCGVRRLRQRAFRSPSDVQVIDEG